MWRKRAHRYYIFYNFAPKFSDNIIINVFFMKKTLLSMMAMISVAMGANAQVMNQEIKGAATLGDQATVLANVAPAAKANAKRKIKDDEKLIGYPGSETPVGYTGWPSVSDAQAVGVQIEDAAKIKKFAAYQVVGMRFIVMGNLGADASCFVWLFGSDQNLKAEGEYELKEGSYDLCTLGSDNQLTVKYNDVYFDTPLTIDATDAAIRYGYTYTQNTNKTLQDAYPILYGKTTEVADGMCFLIYGSFGTKGEGWYLAADAKSPYTPCIQLIVKDKGNNTGILGVDGSVEPMAKQFFTLDGKQLDAPQKGINIVKMSDGTTRKVVK